MMTTRLWQAFKNPPATHPIFQRLTAETFTDDFELFSLLQRMLIQGQIWLWPVLFMLNMRALILMVFSGTVYGAMCAIRISGTIADERRNGRFDLLCLAPVGVVGATWAICMGCLHERRAFEQINSQEAWSVRLILFIPIVISAPFIFRQIFGATFTTSFVGIVAVIMVFYLDHVQSILFGSLLGVLSAHYAPSVIDQRLWALAAFFAVQIVSYCVLIVVTFIILPTLRPYFPSSLYSEAGIPLISVLTFYLLRETMLAQLWRILVRQGSSPAEWNFLSETAIKRTTSGYADPQIVARTP